jgi:opacity protein-like surface antigen
MKKIKKISYPIIAAFSIILCFPNEVSSQDTKALQVVEFGIRYMPTFSSLDLKTYNGDIVKGSANVSNGFGAVLGLNMSRHIGIQGEVIYYQVSQSYRDVNMDRKVDIKYLNIPLLLSFNTNKTRMVNLNIVAGPQFGINVGSTMNASGTENSGSLKATVALKKGDVGFAYGAGLEFALNQGHSIRLDLGYRGFYSFVNMDASTNKDTYNVIVNASRKTNGAYAGLTFLF